MKVLGYSIYTKELDHLPIGSKLVINTLNQYSYCMAEKDPHFKKLLRESDVLLPDGVSIVWAARWFCKRRIRKIAGADLHEFLLKRANTQKSSCFYLGSSESTLKKIKNRLRTEYPCIRIGTYSPPHKPAFSIEDSEEMINAVNNFKPDILFVGMTASKQEVWSSAHKNSLEADYICSIGAVFDFYARTKRRPNDVFINLGLEWFGRLINEPIRLWKRYTYYGFVFGFYMIRERIRLAKK